MRTPFRASPPIRPNDGRRDFQPPQTQPGRQPATRHSSLTSPTSYRPSAASEETEMSRDSLSYNSEVGTPTRDPRPEESTEAQSDKPAPRRPAAEHTFIDRHTTIQGTLRSAKDLRVEGRVEGEIVCDGKITVAEGAVVQARIEAAEVIISGNVEGDVHSHGQFKLQPPAVIRGSAVAARITIEDGATYEGELHMTSDTPRPEELPETPLAGVMAGRSSERARAGSNGNGAGS